MDLALGMEEMMMYRHLEAVALVPVDEVVAVAVEVVDLAEDEAVMKMVSVYDTYE